MNNHLVLDSKIENEVHNASYTTHYPKKKEKQHHVNYIGLIFTDMAQNVIFYAH